MPGNTAATLRVEITAGATSVTLHWPMGQLRELAGWLREVGR